MIVIALARAALVAAAPQETAAAAQSTPVVAGTTTDAAPANTVLIKRDTPVELMAVTEVSTATASPGTVIKLRVNRPIELEGRTIVPVGTPAFGEITAARDAGGLGKSGVMSGRLVRIQLGDAAIPIEGDASAKGTGAGSVGAAVVLVGFMGLFHRGNNAKIKAGEIVSGFVSEDVMLDISGPHPRRLEQNAAVTQ